jgi:hypothetical protein
MIDAKGKSSHGDKPKPIWQVAIVRASAASAVLERYKACRQQRPTYWEPPRPPPQEGRAPGAHRICFRPSS